MLLSYYCYTKYYPTNSKKNCIGEAHERMQAYNLWLIKLAVYAKFTGPNPAFRPSLRDGYLDKLSCTVATGPINRDRLTYGERDAIVASSSHP